MINMASKAKLDRLIALKIRKKSLDKKIEDLQKEILSNSPPETYTGIDGKLTLHQRKNYSVPNNVNLIKHISRETFLEKASMAVSKIVTAVGEDRFKKLLEKGVIIEGPPSRFYQLTILE
jgi:hypothetical protein